MGSNERRRRRSLRLFFILLAVLLVIVAGLSYAQYEIVSAEKTRLTFLDGDRELHTFFVEIAANGADRSKGLMFRKSMDPDSGMAFVYPKEDRHSFWMKNTYIPLDMIFLSPSKQVVGILKEVPILSETSRSIEAQSLVVVELNSGAAEKFGIKVGSRAVFTPSLASARE